LKGAMKLFKVSVYRGIEGLQFDSTMRVFTVKADDIVKAQLRVIRRVWGITGSTMYMLRSAEEATM
jgi:hypothetical protein